MTDGTTIGGALLVVGTGLGTVIKWCVGRIVDAQDRNTAATAAAAVKHADANGELALKLAEVHTMVAVAYDSFHAWSERHPSAVTTPEREAAIERVRAEHAYPTPPKRTATPAGGIRTPRPGTHHDK